jgi:hypothetical protein
LPEAYIAPRQLRDVRELLRHRVTLVAMRSALKNRVHAILARHGVIHQHADLFGKAGRQFLATVELRPAPRQRIDSLLALVENFDRAIDATAKEIDRQAKRDERVALLCQIHGIGRYTAMLIIAEIDDVRRFPTARHLCAWAGLTPTVRSSDGKARPGNISRQGSSILRWALVEAATHLATRGGPLREQFERIAKRRGRKVARVAVTRQILTLRRSRLEQYRDPRPPRCDCSVTDGAVRRGWRRRSQVVRTSSKFSARPALPQCQASNSEVRASRRESRCQQAKPTKCGEAEAPAPSRSTPKLLSLRTTRGQLRAGCGIRPRLRAGPHLRPTNGPNGSSERSLRPCSSCSASKRLRARPSRGGGATCRISVDGAGLRVWLVRRRLRRCRQAGRAVPARDVGH